MKIMLFGISNVGKTTTGRILAQRLQIPFFDIDDEIKAFYGISLEEFVHTGTLKDRDRKRGLAIERILSSQKDCVIAVPPMSYAGYFEKLLLSEDVIAFELRDRAENIFDRLVFSDENDVIHEYKEYKEKHRDHYIREIREDLDWYGKVNQKVENKIAINGMKQEAVAEKIVRYLKRKGLPVE